MALWAKVYVFAMNNDDVDPTPYTQTDLSIITQYKCENLRVLSTFFFFAGEVLSTVGWTCAQRPELIRYAES